MSKKKAKSTPKKKVGGAPKRLSRRRVEIVSIAGEKDRPPRTGKINKK